MCLVTVSLGGCAVPLGPGYTIQKQTLDLHFLPAPQPHFVVDASFDLKNSGNQPLQSLRIVLPPADAIHRTATSAEWNHQPVETKTVPATPADRGDSLEVTLPESWPMKQTRSLTLHYELSTGSHLGSFLSAGSETFFAYPGSWNPELFPPKHLFGTGGVPPKNWTLSVHVPVGYLVHASGNSGKRRDSSGEWIYSFTQPLRGFAPFVAGGKYQEREVRADGASILFWTLRSLDSATAQKAASAIAARVRYYDAEYGAATNGDRTIRLLECVPPKESFGCGGLPLMVLVHENWIARGLSDAGFYQDANFELAYSWFGGTARIRFDESPLPMDALAPYAGWEAQASAEGGTARAERIRTLIVDFDKHAAECKEKVILPLSGGLQGCSYSAAWSKSGLFCFALEDKIGRATLHAALKKLLESRRGRDLSLEDLIAAVDAESRQPQGPFVRTWLKHPGIPEDFRTRYASIAASTARAEANFPEEHQP